MLFSTAFDSERRIQIPSLKLGKNSKEFKCYYDQILFDKFHILPYPTTCIQFLDKKDNGQQQIVFRTTALFYNGKGLYDPSPCDR